VQSENRGDDVIDLMGVEPETGVVVLHVIDDKTWEDYEAHMRWLIDKLNLYIGYVRSGQINQDARYANRPPKFLVHFNGPAPKDARQVMLRIRDHMAQRRIALGVTEATDVPEEVDLDSWANASD